MTKTEASPLSFDEIGDSLILLCDVLGHIQHEYSDIALTNAVYGTLHGYGLKFIVDRRFTPHARCINDLKR